MPDLSQLLSEIKEGRGLTLSAAGRLFPGSRGNEAVDPATVWRWVSAGAKTPSGAKVKLDAARVGSRWVTSSDAVARFVAALTGTGEVPVDRSRSPTRRRQAIAKASARLGELGI